MADLDHHGRIVSEVKLTKITLKPGDVLLAKVSGPDFKDEEVCEALKTSLKSVFPNNEIGVLFLDENSIDLTVISQEMAENLGNSDDAPKTYAEFEATLTDEQKVLAKQLFEAVKPNDLENSENKTCNTQNYCVDCSCGKKEQFEGESNES